MKLIDEKGKLFGKLNIIDLLVIVVVIAALAFAALRLRGGSDPMASTTKLTYTATVSGVDNELYVETLRHLDANGGKDQLMADGALVDGYIVGVTAAPHVNFSAAANGETVRSEEDPANGGRWDLTFTIEANVVNPTTNKVGTQEVRVGKTHIVKTANIEFPYATIMTCQQG